MSPPFAFSQWKIRRAHRPSGAFPFANDDRTRRSGVNAGGEMARTYVRADRGSG